MFEKNDKIVSYDEIIEINNLMNAYRKAKRKNKIAGFDGISPKSINNPVKFVSDLRVELEEKTYISKETIKQSIMKYDGTCMIEFEILCLSDRVIQNAIKNKLLPIFNDILFDGVCGYRGKKYKDQYFMYINNFWNNDYKYIASFDIKSFFNSIDDQLLMKELEKYCDNLVIELINDQLFRNSCEFPLGHILSTLLSNIYLNNVDYIMYKEFGQFIRYGDNYIFPIKEDVNCVKDIEYELDNNLKRINLELNKNKTLVLNEYKNIGIL